MATKSTNGMMDVHSEDIEYATLFIESIMQPFEDIPNSNGMKVLRNVISLETASKFDVVIRTITEAYWQAVIDKTSKYRVCAIGTPGIGKTTSTCVLIRLLLEDKKKVIYHIRTDENIGVVYVFTPPGTEGDIGVNVIPEQHFNPNDYKKTGDEPKNVYYVVDPGKTKDNCNLPDDFDGKVIIVASPDEGHWGDFEKERGSVVGKFLFYPVWNFNELISAKHHFNEDLSDEEIVSRYERVGGIPGNMFTKKADFETILLKQKAAINGLTKLQVSKLFMNDMVTAQIGQPRSTLMVYKCPNGNFEKFDVDYASEYVVRLIAEAHIKDYGIR